MSDDRCRDHEDWDKAIDDSDIVVGGRATPGGRPGTEFLYRRGELLVDARDYEDPPDDDRRRLRGMLDEAGARVADEEADRVHADVADRLGLRLLRTREDVDVEDLALRGRGLSPHSVGHHHVVLASPQRHGGCSPPRPVAATFPIPGRGNAGDGCVVAVLDTGIAKPLPFDAEARDPEDIEVLDELPAGSGTLGPGVGHGTMVAGIVKRYAPGARLLIRRVLHTPLGDATELEIARALLELPDEVEIVVASFGGFAVDDVTMLAFERAVNALPRRALVVAAAGNEAVERPFYMAAFNRVLAVASVDRDAGGWQLASYSNWGHWVDASAEGSDVESTFVQRSPFDDGRAASCGTSFAAPKVAAAAAVLAAHDRIPVRMAAHRLLHDPLAPVLPGAGTVIRP